MIIDGCWSSGFRPVPSTGTCDRVANGLTSPPKSISPVKKTPMPSMIEVAHGTMSRSLWRVTTRATVETIESTQAQSSREPSWLDHMAVNL